jgi:hypothetical protein
MSTPAKDFNDLEKGDRVKWERKTATTGYDEGRGVVFLIWLGVEEMCDIQGPDGKITTVCRAIGDKVIKIK